MHAGPKPRQFCSFSFNIPNPSQIWVRNQPKRQRATSRPCGSWISQQAGTQQAGPCQELQDASPPTALGPARAARPGELQPNHVSGRPHAANEGVKSS